MERTNGVANPETDRSLFGKGFAGSADMTLGVLRGAVSFDALLEALGRV